MPDAAIPIFQTVNQKGEATLEVEAVIKALGISLPERTVVSQEAPDEGTIKWTEPKSAFGYEQHIEGFKFEGNDWLILSSAISTPSFWMRGGLDIRIAKPRTVVSDQTIWTLADSKGNSHFMQIADNGTAGRTLAGFGEIFPTFPGGTTESTTFKVSHGLGVLPKGIFVEPISGAVTVPVAFNYTETTFEIKLLATAVRGAESVTCKWFAIC